MALEQGNMYVAAYEAEFHALCRYSMHLVTTKEERVQFFIKGLDFELQILFVDMTYAGKSYNEVTDYFKKVEGVR